MTSHSSQGKELVISLMTKDVNENPSNINIGINNIISLTTGHNKQIEVIKVFLVAGLRR